MKTSLIPVLLRVVFVLGINVAVSCNNATHIQDVGCTVLFPLESTIPIDTLDQWIQKIEVIPIVGDAAVMIAGASKMIINKEYNIVLSNDAPYALSHNGEVLGRYGSFGRGRGEYLIIRDICLDTSLSEVLCLNQRNQILRYSVKDFHYISSINIDLGSDSASGIVPMGKNRVGVFIANPEGPSVSEFNNTFYCFRVYSYDGKEITHEMPRTDFNISASFVPPVFQFNDNSYSVSPGSLNMPVFVYTEGEKSRVISFDFQKKNLPFRYAFEKGGNPWNRVNDIFSQDYYKLITPVLSFGASIYFSAIGKNSSRWNFVINNDTSRGIRWRSFSRMHLPIFSLGSDGTYLYYILDITSEYNDQDVQFDPLERYVFQNYRSTISHDSPLLVRIQFLS